MSKKNKKEPQRPVKDVVQATEEPSEPVISDAEHQKSADGDLADNEITIDEEREKEDSAMDVNPTTEVAKPAKKSYKDVDPEFSINSSKYALYDKATRMKVDEVEPAEEVHFVTVTKISMGILQVENYRSYLRGVYDLQGRQ